jgi:hypothetical protein
VALVTLADPECVAAGRGDGTVTARLDPTDLPQEGATVAVALPLEQAHLFDRVTGGALSHGFSRQ